jgi:twitching motility two-component system response regulator PilH
MSQILLVEDSQTEREYLAEILASHGIEVTVACDGIEALEQMVDLSPDLILLDIVMPRMNGYEVCRRLKSNPKTKDVPVIICSLKKQEFDRYWGIKQGADAYLPKPIRETELISTIKQLLRKPSA